MDIDTTVTIIITIFLAFIGYLATYWNNIKIAQHQERLDRVNRQIKNLYGPLYALVTSANTTWIYFRRDYRPGGSFWGNNKRPSKEEAEAWRLWMSEVFMPLNIQMEKIFLENADLIDEDVMPDCLLSLSAHVSAYKPVLKKWKDGDYSENTSVIKFPREELLDYVKSNYSRLKGKQKRLLEESTFFSLSSTH
jgi:hypothetical protein